MGFCQLGSDWYAQKPKGILIEPSVEGTPNAGDPLVAHSFLHEPEAGQTVAIDVRKRTVVSTWCSCDDPGGRAVESKRGFVFVACRNHVIVSDTVHDGRVVGSIATGGGVDNIDYVVDTGLLYAAAAEAAQLTVARFDDNGKPTHLA